MQPGDTSFSAQYIFNRLYGSSPTQYTIQAIANMQMGQQATTQTLQAIINSNLGNPSPTTWSVQLCLYTILSPLLNLSAPYTALSEQYMLNRAYKSGISLSTILGQTSSGSAGSNVGLNLLYSLIGP